MTQKRMTPALTATTNTAKPTFKNVLLGAALFMGTCLSTLLSTPTQSHAAEATPAHSAKPCLFAPKSLTNKTMVLQIEALTSTNPDLYPAKGVIVQRYLSTNTFRAHTVGASIAMDDSAQYRYRRTRKFKATETAIDTAGNTYTTQYKFQTPNQGTWQRAYNNEDTQLSGTFTLEPSDSSPIAPENQNGLTLSLSVLSAHSDALPSGAYPGLGTVILQSYEGNATYEGQGFGPGTVDHYGTYSTTKVSANTIVEETLQTIPAFGLTVPYTMVYTYQTPYSGTWFQNFGDGLIIFSGTFTAFTTP